MDTAQDPQLFTLSIDGATRTHFADAARWARFIAIAGMVFLALAVVGIAVFVYFLQAAESAFSEGVGNRSIFSGASLGIGLFYLMLVVIWFLPLWYLLRFAKAMQIALKGNEPEALTAAAQHLKVCFRYVGIVSIVVLGLYAITMLLGILGLALIGT